MTIYTILGSRNVTHSIIIYHVPTHSDITANKLGIVGRRSHLRGFDMSHNAMQFRINIVDDNHFTLVLNY